MSEIKATNITWHEGHVTREERSALLKQKGCTLWFTGLSASGKSTIAFTLEHALVQQGKLAYALDGGADQNDVLSFARPVEAVVDDPLLGTRSCAHNSQCGKRQDGVCDSLHDGSS